MNTWNKKIAVAVVAFMLSMSLSHAGAEPARVNADEAARSAIAKAGGGKVVTMHLVGENGRSLYRVLLVDNADRIDVDVDAANGDVTKFAKRKINAVKTMPKGMAGWAARLDPVQVEPTVLAATGGGVIVRTDKKTAAHGEKRYDFEVVRDDAMYTVEVDANSGDIVHFQETAIASALPATVASK